MEAVVDELDVNITRTATACLAFETKDRLLAFETKDHAVGLLTGDFRLLGQSNLIPAPVDVGT